MYSLLLLSIRLFNSCRWSICHYEFKWRYAIDSVFYILPYLSILQRLAKRWYTFRLIRGFLESSTETFTSKLIYVNEMRTRAIWVDLKLDKNGLCVLDLCSVRNTSSIRNICLLSYATPANVDWWRDRFVVWRISICQQLTSINAIVLCKLFLVPTNYLQCERLDGNWSYEVPRMIEFKRHTKV